MAVAVSTTFSEQIPKQRGKFAFLQSVRIALLSVLVAFLTSAIEVGLPLVTLLLASAGGTLLSGALLVRGKTFFRVLIWHVAVFLILRGALFAANFILLSGADSQAAADFIVPRFGDDIFLILLFYSISFLSTWYYWTSEHAVTVEGILSAALFVALMSGHRNYHIDAPKEISSLTWKNPWLQRLHMEPQHLFLALGCVFIFFLCVYLVFSSGRPLFNKKRRVYSGGRSHKLLAAACPLIVLAALGYYAYILNASYEGDLSRASNGVGMNQQGGGLGFHSATSPTKQAAALVRLEGDYTQNPWKPMLYFREGALSQFNGRELVAAGMNYDTDVPRIAAGQPLHIEEEDPGPNRQRVVQSIYLLTKHGAPFAVDFPRRIVNIVNPAPDRFQLAYQAVSHAPVQTIETLLGGKTGSSSWTQADWDHYLRAPGSTATAEVNEEAGTSPEPVLDPQGEDLRYKSFAQKITAGVDDPVAKAFVISKFLSENSIYTRNPGHQVTARGDPVAPYLFSDKKRGYCVHFAHAAAYLMRLVGLPSRIATGYLVDLTYAKDGHILLQVGDRHAWPEVFIEGHGWMVFDVTPAQAEGEQVLIPDEKLLEELMSKLDPAQELLEPLPFEPDTSPGVSILKDLMTRRNIAGFLLTLAVLWALYKGFLRYGYLVVRDDRRRVWLAYSSFASLLCDVGMARDHGETRREYSERLRRAYGIDALDITLLNEANTYGKRNGKASKEELSRALRSATASFDTSRSRVRRVLAFFSPLSFPRVGSW